MSSFDKRKNDMALVKTTIDGREIEVQRDRWALDVAGEMGISIPTLCNHPALEPYGACRLCVVEVTKGKWTWLTTSCDLPIREGLSIRTDTPGVISARRMAVELMWAHTPDAEVIQELAGQLGVKKPRFPQRLEGGKCILCGLCIRVCKEIIGQSAICFSQRGPARTVGSPFQEPSDLCIGCNACVSICPTGCVESIEDGPLRRLVTWNTDLEMARCQECERPFIPVRQLEYMRAKLPEHLSIDLVCQTCRRSKTAERLSEISAMLENQPVPGVLK